MESVGQDLEQSEMELIHSLLYSIENKLFYCGIKPYQLKRALYTRGISDEDIELMCQEMWKFDVGFARYDIYYYDDKYTTGVLKPKKLYDSKD